MPIKVSAIGKKTMATAPIKRHVCKSSACPVMTPWATHTTTRKNRILKILEIILHTNLMNAASPPPAPAKWRITGLMRVFKYYHI